MPIKFRLIIFIVFLIISAIAAGFFLNKEYVVPTVLSCIFIIIFTINIISIVFNLYIEVNNFAEAIQSNDFSRKFPANKIRKNILYKHFNDINESFLQFSQEKEAQSQYFKKVLELVDTGILVYDIKTNEIIWMNDSLGNMLQIPKLKNIDWLKKRDPNLYLKITDIPLGENKLITINSGKQTIKTITNASHFQTNDKAYKLIAFHNIGNTLEEVESGAWKGLLNVMTHEIMNSIAPVASLAGTLKKRIHNIREETEHNLHPDFEDIEFALETIHKRSDGLLRFSETYRSLNQKITPEIHSVNLFELLQSVYHLMNPSLESKGILFEIKTDSPSVVASIDRNLIEQTIINLITNASYALKDKKDPTIIIFSGITAEKNPYITVADNGHGISDEVRDKIFIPFFSTKKYGSGIGLSISREIIKLHKGSIIVQSEEGKGSAFTLLFNQIKDDLKNPLN